MTEAQHADTVLDDPSADGSMSAIQWSDYEQLYDLWKQGKLADQDIKRNGGANLLDIMEAQFILDMADSPMEGPPEVPLFRDPALEEAAAHEEGEDQGALEASVTTTSTTTSQHAESRLLPWVELEEASRSVPEGVSSSSPLSTKMKSTSARSSDV